VVGVAYPEGFGDPNIASVFDRWRGSISTISSSDEIRRIGMPGPVIIDITGLRTTFLWEAVRRALALRQEVFIAYTRAARYAPSDEEVRAVLALTTDSLADSTHLDRLRELVSGESHDYQLIPLLETRDDIMRPLALVAAASPKMMRLEHLLSSRSFDRLELLASNRTSPRANLSRVAAQAAAVGVQDSHVSLCAPTDLAATVQVLEEMYQPVFVGGGMDVALGLTGSKIQAVAMAALSMSVKVAEAWYVQPSSYDAAKFTGGSGSTLYYRISLPQRPVAVLPSAG
jgi:hypothetical protein